MSDYELAPMRWAERIQLRWKVRKLARKLIKQKALAFDPTNRTSRHWHLLEEYQYMRDLGLARWQAMQMARKHLRGRIESYNAIKGVNDACAELKAVLDKGKPYLEMDGSGQEWGP